MRVPTWVWVGDLIQVRYAISVGLFTYRFYKHDTVPKEITTLIAMIRAFPKEVRKVHGQGLDRYCPPDPRLEDIGWEVNSGTFSSESYVLILDDEFVGRELGREKPLHIKEVQFTVHSEDWLKLQK